jgi:predicted helicase
MNNDKKLAQVFHFDLYGKRQEKYNFLLNNDLQTVKWQNLELREPQYFFTKKDFSQQKDYEQGFSVQELFPVNSVGVVTARNAVFMNNNRNDLIKNIREHFNTIPDETLICKINYRPFDNQYIYYDVKKVERARENVMQHFLKGENMGLMVCKQFKQGNFQHCLVHNNIVESSFVSNKTSEIGYVFPLYLYQENFGQTEKIVNMKEAIVASIRSATGTDIEPVEIFDYIYAVLHSPSYREKYKEFLKIDFPHIPYPENAEEFEHLAGLGERLRKLHLMENVEIQQDAANFPVAGTNEIEKQNTIKIKFLSTTPNISITCRKRHGNFTSAVTNLRKNG